METGVSIDYENYEEIVVRHPAEGINMVIAVCYAAILVVGIVGNCWVAWMVGLVLFFGKGAKVPKSIQFYILVLCVSDILILLAMSLLLADMIIGEWVFGQFACIVYLSFDALNKFAAPLILAFLSGTCYASICRPSLDKQVGSLSRAMIAVLMAFIVVFTLLTPVFRHSGVHSYPIRRLNNSRQEFVLKKCGFNPPPSIAMSFNLYACFLGYMVPTACFVYFYVSVLFFLKHHAQHTTTTGATGHATLWRVGKVVFALIVVYVGCWTPYWVIIWVSYIKDQLSYGLILLIYMVHLLPYISCSAYPIIYTAMNRGIKDAHAKIMNRQRRRMRSLTEEAAVKLEAVRYSLTSRTRTSQDSTMASTLFMHHSASGGHNDKTLYMPCPIIDNREEISVVVSEDRREQNGWETIL